MNTSMIRYAGRNAATGLLVAASLLLASCAAAPTSPPGAEQVRSRLTALQNTPELAERARVDIQEAEAAVIYAERPLPADDTTLGKHRVFMAEQAVAIAEARAETRYAVDQRLRLGEERDDAR